MGLSGYIVLLAISLHLVLGEGETFTSNEDKIIDKSNLDNLEESERTARHADGYGYGNQGGYGFKTGYGHHHGPPGYNRHPYGGYGPPNNEIFVPKPETGPLKKITNWFGFNKKQPVNQVDATQNFLMNARQIPPAGSCRQPLRLPQNVQYECRDSSCRLMCPTNFFFPGGVSQLNVICVSGKWIVRDSQIGDLIPPCAPACIPPCQNNGICLEPGLCQCPENFYGPFCQSHNLQCASKPHIPNGSKVSCRNNKCNVECIKGYQFPDGSSITNLDCVDGEWHHPKSGSPKAPDCQPTCNPPCQNGGKCTSVNMCQCPKEFRGPQCQYDSQVCNVTMAGFNGNYRCSFDVLETSCTLSCPGGIEMSGPKSSTYKCEYNSGKFSPPLPSCLYPKGYKVVSSKKTSSIKTLPGEGYYNYNSERHESSEVENSLEFVTKWKQRTKNSEFFSSSEEYLEAPIIYSLYFEEYLDMTIDRSPKPALCATWSGINLKTFDGTIFKAPLSCSHTLVSDKIDGTFDIILKACPYGSGYNCPHSLKIFWQSIEYTFENSNGTVKLSTPQKNLPIPVQVKGMKVLPVAQHLRIDLDSVGMSVLWDKAQYVAMQATPGLWNRTGGMCGSFDGDHRNDFISKDGVLLKTGKAFADSWKATDDSALCFMDNSGEVDFSKQCEAKDQLKAIETCEQLLTNAKLTECVKPYNMNALMKSCVNDYCNCANKDHPEMCNCDAIAMLAKECEFRGVKLEHGWRDLQICPIHCSYGRVYLPCGPNLEPTCGSAVMPNKDKCNEGCFCPEGTVQYKDSCISPELCPCMMRNKEFKAGSTIKKDCNTCTCTNGVWKCTDENCGARCSAIGDPHYTTFDGKNFDFMGKCSYYMLKTDNITVETENVPCSGAISESMDYAPSSTLDTPSCTKSVTITSDINGVKTTIKLGQNLVTHVNDKEVLKFPKITGNDQILIRQASSTFMTVDFTDGISVWWDGQTRMYIDAPPSLREKTSGLCGTFNSKTQDDFLTPEGDVETAVEPFANKWRTKDTCDDQSESEPGPHPCTANPQMREVAEKHCAWLTDDIFLDCQWSVEPETYYENCIYDVCACKEDPSKCFCPILSAYGAECTRQGIKTGWRYTVKECGIQCPVGQIYEECGDSCTRTCDDVATEKTCQRHCIEGCRCPKGEYLNDKNECVPAKECPCVFEGMPFNTGYKEVRPGRQFLELCTCEGGVWNCDMAEAGDKEKYPPSSELKSQCANKPNAEFSKCVPVEPKTCKTMDTYVENLEDCSPGCACMEGYVFDTTTKECVIPEDCPCHHGGKSYSGGDKMSEDCNVCLCQSGNWKCTTNECEGTCSVWGDSHFTTFDNHDFDFQGACDYILSKGVAANGDSYSITIQNVLCGTLGVTCSKSLQIVLGGSIEDTITLSADSSYLDDQSKAPIDKLREELGSKGHSYNIYKAGVFTVIEIIPLKLQIKWDEGTRVYVKLGKDWKGKVNGLCGNYNGNANDDMKTPSQGLETSPFLFGHSWKLQEFCAAPTQQIDACKEHPQRETWAQLKCGILKSSLFKDCHSEVPVEKYLKRCIFDTCACDQGGDCECLCTAIAAYAHSCSTKGINIRWRTQHFCPMQCDPHCSEYKSCTPVCAVETCDNFLDQGITDRMCLNENCIEGCQIKPCDEGMIYLNDSFTKCVPKSECKPVCMLKDGKTYYEGDVTFSDECQTCRCTKKKEVCSGVPCAKQLTTTPPPIEASSTVKPLQTEEETKCTSGWTRWINQDQDSNVNEKHLKLNDLEKLPKFDHFESIYGTCDREFIKKIECRVVDTHEKAESMDENSYCSLEDGLVCNGNCHDYEIRVFCRCGSEEIEEIPTQPPPAKIIDQGKSCNATVEEYREYPDDCYKFLHCQPQPDEIWEYVEKTCGPWMMFNPVLHVCDHIASVQAIKPVCGGAVEPTELPKIALCPPGKVWSDCANHCEHTCHYFDHKLSKRGLCNPGDICKAGCVDETEPNCPALNKMWRDKDTCVDIDECPCMSDDEKYIKPNSVYKQTIFDDDQTCQCIDNIFFCKSFDEQKKLTTALPDPGIIHVESVTTELPFVIPSSSTPPLKCDPKLLVPMINGAEPLPDSVFNASSTLSDSYLPHFGRLHSKPLGKSKGSWSPLINDQMQYLQVAFDEPQPLFGVIMQGSPVSDQHVTLFKILYSTDGVAFHYLVDETDKPQMFNGPIDSRTPVESLFKIPIEAKVVRIYPLKWHGAITMRVELLGCGKEPEKSTTIEQPFDKLVATTERSQYITTTETIACTDCRDPMGVESGAMHHSQIRASSMWPRPLKAKKVHLLDMLKLSSTMSWRPALNTQSEYVEFDFLEPRNISGLITKGGPEGFVSGYKVLYSQNNFVWNNVLAPDGSPRVFIANNDQDTPETNYFKYPIQTKMLKVVPLKWKENINMRIEPLGCFTPYPEVKETVEITETKPVSCPICDNIVSNPDDKECKCKELLMWDGNNCVDRNMCPCVENYISYPIGSKFENKNCQECVCILGGVKQCKPKKCPSCDAGLRVIQTPTCICKCEPCPEMQKLCPSSGDCIPEALWCNGVKDCEDDEPAECTKIIEDTGKPTMETSTTTTKQCPAPECPKGMKMKVIEQSATREMSEIFKTTVTKKFSTFNDGHKITRTKTINLVEEYLPTPEFESGYNDVEDCAEFVCTPEVSSSTVQNVSFSCTLPKCPDNYEVEVDNSRMKPGDCLKYTCILRPQKDRVCELSGKSFTTFDGTEFKYDTCSHILARNLVNSTWYISVQLNCTENRKVCRKMLVIKDIQSDVVLTIMPNLKLKFNGFVYTPGQLQKSPLAKSAFIISQPGNTILVVSRSHGFWALYDEIGGIKIGVSEKFIKTVDGLCGYFNGNPADDKRLPDGTITSSTNKFGDSWFDKDIPKEECYPQVCPRDIQMKALSLCNSIKHPSFLKCGKAVNYKQFVSKCIETTCECLKANKDGDTKSCKCSILQGFVKQCLAMNPQIQLDTWRAVHQCEISCPAPLVHSDCYKRRCEPSCDNLNGDDCPVLPDACFSGCYCPEGTVRKGDTCIPINECKDCICDAFGTSKYLTYDRKNFTFNGNCTYLLSRDIVLPGVHTFQVYVTMDDCKKLGRPTMGPNTSCAKSLHILHGEHIIHIQRVVPNKSVQVLIDGMEVKKLPFKDTWLGITETNSNELKLTLPESHVEVTSSFDDMAYSIRVPSIKYGSKMEGLCGDCNGDPDNDLKMNPAKKRGWKSNQAPVDVMDIVESWKADEPKLGLDQDECLSEEIPIESCIPLPPEKDPCFKFFDEELFGKCSMIVDPLIYVSACQQDMCKPGNDQKGACNSLAAYARECSRNQVCLNWRSPNLCPYECPSSMIYEPCGCLKTCETIKNTNIFEVENIKTNTVVNPKKDLMTCAAGLSEGCFCPPGMVMDNDKCVPEEQCIKCDDGQHSVGDTWKKDKCTECTCNSNGKTECAVQQCPVQESICSEGFMPSKISSSEECCPKYICVPEPKVPTPVTCPDAPFPKCGAGQFKKQKIGSDGCPQFICECKPVSECEPLPESVPLKPGEKLVPDYSGCCPTQNIVCDTKTCPELISQCSQKFYQLKVVTHLGDCCPTVVCSPPKDDCIVDIDGITTLKNLGDRWNVPENPCIQKLCSYGPNDTTQVTEIVEECDTKCKKGYEYKNLDKTKCCGSCVQTKCVFEEKLYSVGDQWFSDDNCTTYTCEDNDGQILVSSSKEVCLDVSNCPPGQLKDLGCCKICTPMSESQKNCLPVSLSESETNGLIRLKNAGHGMCLNKEPILGFTECYGSCESGSKYNVESFGQDKMCFCCAIEAYKTISVPLTCEDGFKTTKDIEIPSSCGCSACADSKTFDYSSLIDIRMSRPDKNPIKRLIKN